MKMKLQDFATECGVTDRAIQKHIQKHEEALQGHFERRGPNGTWLDDFAQEYIRNLMVRPAPTVISDARLVQENRELQETVASQAAIIEDKDRLISRLLEENARLHASVGRLEGSEATHKLLTESAQAQAERAHQEAKEAREKHEKEVARANALEVALARQEAREEALMNRGLWDRIRNTEV